ncbi:methyltransferase N6AMT1-like [Ornithodoros turicata]|uniref:methyltransferase N6AMT1-like n=1 Tax=Ornithodoros turicata TaxID=34597 RepID=UPI00313928AD
MCERSSNTKDEIETPALDHFTTNDYDCVYEPAEDSFLLIDALEKELSDLRRRNPAICLEVGCGSGIISAALAKALGNTCYMLATDINVKASEATKRTGERNGVHVEPVVTDLVSSLLPRLRHKVDILIFNPPYVVTPSEECLEESLTKAWAGGHLGREVTDRLSLLVPDLLSPTGLYFLVVIRENKPDEIRKSLARKGLQSKIVISRRCGAEFLSVICFYRENS